MFGSKGWCLSALRLHLQMQRHLQRGNPAIRGGRSDQLQQKPPAPELATQQAAHPPAPAAPAKAAPAPAPEAEQTAAAAQAAAAPAAPLGAGRRRWGWRRRRSGSGTWWRWTARCATAAPTTWRSPASPSSATAARCAPLAPPLGAQPRSASRVGAPPGPCSVRPALRIREDLQPAFCLLPLQFLRYPSLTGLRALLPAACASACHPKASTVAVCANVSSCMEIKTVGACFRRIFAVGRSGSVSSSCCSLCCCCCQAVPFCFGGNSPAADSVS